MSEWPHDDEVRVTGFHHVQLALPPGGEDAARGFYAGLLGFTEVPKPAPLAARGGCWFDFGGIQVHLGVDADFRPARKAHPALSVVGLATLRKRLEGAGAEVADDTRLDGHDRCYVSDPFGNRIELIEARRAG